MEVPPPSEVDEWEEDFGEMIVGFIGLIVLFFVLLSTSKLNTTVCRHLSIYYSTFLIRENAMHLKLYQIII